MVLFTINWAHFTPPLDTVGIYNICKIHTFTQLYTKSSGRKTRSRGIIDFSYLETIIIII